MNQSEKHKFEEEWERMFEAAAETPPPSVWDAIEKHLDEEHAPAIVPLVWWKHPKVAYAAAAVVALLLVSWPIMKLTKESDKQPSQVATAALPENPAGADPSASVTSRDEPMTLTERKEAVAGRKESQSRQANRAVETTSASELALLDKSEKHKAETTGQKEFPIEHLGDTKPPVVPVFARPTRQNALAETIQKHEENTLAATAAISPTLNQPLALLSPVGVSEVQVYMQKRYVFYQHEVQQSVDILPPSHAKEYWAGVGIMPASFNPGVSVTSPPAAFSMAKASRQSLSNSSKAGLSYAVQMQTGMKLSKHWMLETGLSYLQGNSTFESDGYVLDASTNRSANVLEGALLAGSSASKDYAISPSFTENMNTAAVYIDLDQRTTNNYRFVQLPVQAGYVLNPEGKVSYTLLGGPVANVFLRNEIESGAGNSVVNTADDGLYRSLSWSAATGVRLNYRVSDHWSASLTGSYQKAISSSLRSGTLLESRPQLYGVAWGIRYIF